MFGEHPSESPRVPSPWDPFLPSPPHGASPPFDLELHKGVPKLVPEVEEGNVEYKLKLTNISPARFARLVTQLKWRLLEGGGQAYYELGVADTGALIGLSRADLERSLETLELMAGEIGASVIVVKEIEVPPALATLADGDTRYTDPATGEWTRKMRRRVPAPHDTDSAPTTEAEAEAETDFSSATDNDDGSGLLTPALAYPIPVRAAAVHRKPQRSNPNRPTAQSSPFITPLDDDLALFSMEPEPAHREEAWPVLDAAVPPLDLGERHASFAGLEIAAVFKPRPVRMRGAPDVAGATAGRHGKRTSKPKEKKAQPWHQATAKGRSADTDAPASKEEQAAQRRIARDKRREEKRQALVALAAAGVPAPETTSEAGTAGDAVAVDVGRAAAEIEEEVEALAHGLVELHVSVSAEESPVLMVQRFAEEVEGGAEVEKEREPRLIVEALVVRKMSIEEATLDFGGFSLI